MTTTEPAAARRGLPTTYAGHTFRSRLEARFAVLFDGLAIRWEYEPEGFELPSGLYVPDFWLPQLRAWVEVKPDPECVVESPGWERAHDLMAFTGQTVLMAPGLDHFGAGETIYLRLPATTGHKCDYVTLVELSGRLTIVSCAWAGDVGPRPLRSRRVAEATARAKAATFERPSRIPAYPLVVR